MLRFAVHCHRHPGGSPRRHGPSGRNISRRVQVGVARVSAGNAQEKSLTLATLPGDMTADRATLAGKCGVDLLDPTSSLVADTGGEQRPSAVEDRPIQSCLLPHIPARLRPCPASGAGHVRYSQIFEADHIVSAGDVGAGLLYEVLAPVGVACVQTGQPNLRLHPAPRPALTARHRPGRPTNSDRTGRLVHRAIRQGEGDGDTPVDAHHAAIAGTRDRSGHHREGDMPSAGGIGGDAIGLEVRQLPSASKSHPPDLRDVHPRPAPVELLHTLCLGPDDPESFVAASLAPPRPTVRSPTPVRHGLVEVPQSLLLHRLAAGRQPAERGTCLGQLLALFNVTRYPLAVSSITELLDCQVPHKPSMPALRLERAHLRACRIRPEPHSQTMANRTDISTASTSLTAPRDRASACDRP
ncbi:MAG: hypothetical protein QOE32_95 [Pseudonocardiales bacterium]|nr:hypothetical protein [Pseudonocardiales bacterium]